MSHLYLNCDCVRTDKAYTERFRLSGVTCYQLACSCFSGLKAGVQSRKWLLSVCLTVHMWPLTWQNNLIKLLCWRLQYLLGLPVLPVKNMLFIPCSVSSRVDLPRECAAVLANLSLGCKITVKMCPSHYRELHIKCTFNNGYMISMCSSFLWEIIDLKMQSLDLMMALTGNLARYEFILMNFSFVYNLFLLKSEFFLKCWYAVVFSGFDRGVRGRKE